MEALLDIAEILGESRHVVVARELTKVHEEFLRGRAGDVLANLKQRETVKGEITLLIAKAEDNTEEKSQGTSRASVRERVQQLMSSENIDEKAALKRVAKERGVSKSEAYRELQRDK